MNRRSLLLFCTWLLLSLSCTKGDRFDEGGEKWRLDAAEIGIKVDTPGPENKAAKTAWTDGDRINIWFDGHYSQNEPDLVLEYNVATAKWEKLNVRKEATVGAGGTLCALYETTNDLAAMYKETTSTATLYQGAPGKYSSSFRSTPMLVAANARSYTYDSGTNRISATISGWKYFTRFKVLVQGLTSSADNYALKVYRPDNKNILSRPLATFGPRKDENTGKAVIAVSTGSTDFAAGVKEDDGIAFYFDSLGAEKDEPVHFGLHIYNEDDRIYTVDAKNRIQESETACKGVRLDFSSFSKPVNGGESIESVDDGGDVDTDERQDVDLSGREWSPYIQNLDFSYAGYKYGECAPPNIKTFGWKTYNVCDYGAVPNDGKSDRDAFIKCLCDALKVKWSKTSNGIQFTENANAQAIVYFPEGEFILHSEEDNNEDGTSNTLLIRSGNWVLKGAGRGKTILRTTAPGFPGEPTASEKFWSGVPLMTITCWDKPGEFAVPIAITGNSAKGAGGVTVNSTAGLAAGKWIMISATVSDKDYIERCLQPYGSKDLKTADIYTTGVKYGEYHQIKSISGNTVTFFEPIMFDIDAQYGFKILDYRHYENVGIEDLTFKSCTAENYTHNASYLWDSGCIMIWTRRLVNSWIRRVDFDSVTEGITYECCANCSAYDLECYGTRGHALARSASSTRIFIGATKDHSNGTVNDTHNPVYTSRSYLEGAGQFHATGVNALCIGSVIWRNSWGLDSNFEMHAQQPRATLIDCCDGGWMIYRGGGQLSSQPNHLEDLIIWNMESRTANNNFTWWRTGTAAYKVIPPVIVGFHGAPCSFNTSEVKLDYSHGTAVDPESLYEAQLVRRMGYLPAWVSALKALK